MKAARKLVCIFMLTAQGVIPPHAVGAAIAGKHK